MNKNYFMLPATVFHGITVASQHFGLKSLSSYGFTVLLVAPSLIAGNALFKRLAQSQKTEPVYKPILAPK